MDGDFVSDSRIDSKTDMAGCVSQIEDLLRIRYVQFVGKNEIDFGPQQQVGSCFVKKAELDHERKADRRVSIYT